MSFPGSPPERQSGLPEVGRPADGYEPGNNKPLGDC